MSNTFVFSNNASSLLASAIGTGDTTITVTASTGALFPTITAGDQAAITLEDVSGDIEVVYATGRTGDSLTVVRAQEGTTALAFASGSCVEMRVTEAVLASFLQKTGGDTLSGTTILSGVLTLGSGGSIQGGEIAGTPVRGSPGETDNQFLVPTGGGNPTIGGSVVLTTANVGANMPAGSALVVTNMIVLWHGLSSAIPSGWALCNGTSGTPDLRDQFIVGGGGALAATGSYAAVTDPASAGTPTITPFSLVAGNLPSHLHPIDYFSSAASQYIGVPGFAGPSNSPASSGITGTRNTFAGSPNTGAGTVPLAPICNAMSTHTHTIESPPYTAVFFIMKL
jgi:hypothetical protein